MSIWPDVWPPGTAGSRCTRESKQLYIPRTFFHCPTCILHHFLHKRWSFCISRHNRPSSINAITFWTFVSSLEKHHPAAPPVTAQARFPSYLHFQNWKRGTAFLWELSQGISSPHSHSTPQWSLSRLSTLSLLHGSSYDSSSVPLHTLAALPVLCLLGEVGGNQNHRHCSQHKHMVIITGISIMMFSVLVSIPPSLALYYSIYFLTADENWADFSTELGHKELVPALQEAAQSPFFVSRLDCLFSTCENHVHLCSLKCIVHFIVQPPSTIRSFYSSS